MKKLSMCRICLVEDVRMQLIVDSHLQEMYESLTSMPFETEDNRPLLACYMCCAKLKNCYQLRKQCLRSEEMFTQMLNSQVPVPAELGDISPTHRLRVTAVTHLTLGPVNCEVKLETPDVTYDVQVKMEHAEVFEDERFEEDVIKSEEDAQSYVDDLLIPVRKEESSYVPTSNLIPQEPTPAIDTNSEDLTANNIKREEKIKQKKIFTKNYSTTYFRTQTCEKPYKCNTCKKTFNQKGHLTKHIRTHAGGKAYECKYCKKWFNQNNDLIRHICTHSGKKPYQCSECMKCFNEKRALSRHIRTHTGEKRYKCNICKACFRYETSFTTHMIKHTGVVYI